MTTRSVRIGTRGSALARWQADWVADRLGTILRGRGIEIVQIRSRGDRHQGPLPVEAGPGHFTSDLEEALARDEIDVAVHSLKDLPVDPSPGVHVAAVPRREDPRDALVAREGMTLDSLPEGARVGTSSQRRACLVRALRADLEIAPLRGNVDTRVRVVEEGRLDAVLLAAAGLIRLGLADRVSEWLDPRAFPPAPGQGALAVQVRSEDAELQTLVARLDDPDARSTSTAERQVLAGLGSGCSLPVGAHAWVEEGGVGLVGFAGSPTGDPVLRVEVAGTDPVEVGREAAERLIAAGAAGVLG